VSGHTHPANESANDPYALYASPVGPRMLAHANTIFEDFSVSKYVFYFVVFMIEVAAVFYLGIKLVQ
jgi:hypothetical protein